MVRLLLQVADNELDSDKLVETFIRGFADGLILAWPLLVVMAAFVCVIGAARIIGWSLRRRRLAKAGIDEIDAMGGRTFEHYLEVLFSKLGYRVELSKYFGDLGGDLVIQKDGVRTMVQAKRWKRNVGVEAVQQVVAAKAVYRCTQAMVVTNSHYTRAASELARKNHVVMWDREQLIKELERVNAKAAIRADDVAASIGEEAPAVTAAAALADVVACATCSKVLTAGERQYCARNSKRFAGHMLCFRHQRVRQPTT
jgi:restriction system protein